MPVPLPAVLPRCGPLDGTGERGEEYAPSDHEENHTKKERRDGYPAIGHQEGDIDMSEEECAEEQKDEPHYHIDAEHDPVEH